MRILLSQIAAHVGDVAYNLRRIQSAYAEASRLNCDILALPELVVSGYPPDDLLYHAAFLEACDRARDELVRMSGQTSILFGHPAREGSSLFNRASLAQNGQLLGTHDKQALPNYGVFDEARYFTPGQSSQVFSVNGQRVGVGICEDLWDDGCVASFPMDAMINLNASPFHVNKQKEREALTIKRAALLDAPVCYVNCVGGQDEVVFDGGSHVAMPCQGIVCRSTLFEENSIVFNTEEINGDIASPGTEIEQIWHALVMGVRDYVLRNGSSEVVLGLSGGIDSAVCAAIAAAALGSDKVLGVMMPSQFSSDHSLEDAEELAGRIGMKTIRMPIQMMVDQVEESLKPHFKAWNMEHRDVTEENIQARIRGLVQMAISNKTGRMLISTGNKSETAVGYSTLYGDMAGGFSPLKDVYKTQVYALANLINEKHDWIPQHSIDKAPSAELRPNQADQDSLPDYDVLDAILKALIESHQDVRQIVEALTVDSSTVSRVADMVRRAEYKRRQAPPGIKVSQRAFGRDRRYPMTHGFHEKK